MHLWFIYFISSFITYIILSALYAYEMRGVWQWKTAMMLALVKGAHWGASMEMEQAYGALLSAIVCSLVFHGIQHGVDLKMSAKPLPRPLYRLWYRSWLSLFQIIDSYLHLAIFVFLSPYTTSSILLALFNVVGHTVGMVVTYPAVSAQRHRPTFFDGFLPYYIRSSLAAFFITLIASLF